MTEQAPAGWHPDPFGRYAHRYWDGTQWTEHVASPSGQGFDPPVGAPPAQTVVQGKKNVVREVRRVGVAANAQHGGGTLFTEPVLVVNQKAKLVEINTEYAVYDQHGHQIGAVREVGQSIVKKAIALRTDSDRSYRLQLVDNNGHLLLELTRPAKFFRSRLIVRDASGVELGQIIQKNFGFFHAVRFGLEAGGQPVGSISADDGRGWEFSIQDSTGNEIGRVTKTWPGLAKAMFTKTENYVVEINQSLVDPLRSLVIAASLAVDLAMKELGGNDLGPAFRI
jgi:uncharacterized protein YxjI